MIHEMMEFKTWRTATGWITGLANAVLTRVRDKRITTRTMCTSFFILTFSFVSN
jgi:hypothetical protein